MRHLLVALIALGGGCVSETSERVGGERAELFDIGRFDPDPPSEPDEPDDDGPGTVIVRDHRTGHGDAWEGTPGFVEEETVYLRAGVPATFEARAVSTGADPVLHLLPWSANTAGNTHARQVAMDDDGGSGENARLVYTPRTSGLYILVLRAKSSRTGGLASLYRDGRYQRRVSFGGWFVSLRGLRREEVLQTVPLPGGPAGHKLYVLGSDGGLWLRARPGPHGSAVHEVESDAGTRMAILGVAAGTRLGPLRLVRNDAALGDADGDGLGDELEEAVQTCSRLSGIAGDFECDRAVDPRDTDGDGIADGHELLGRIDSDPPQRLPTWGADPRHKDIFLEIDFMRRASSDVDEIMPVSVLREMARRFADDETSAIYRLFHAQSLVNPDLEAGVSLHFDIGMDPPLGAPAEDFALYGDWGGHDAVPPVCEDGECRGEEADEAYDEYMAEARRGLFHYVLAYDEGGGQAPYFVVASSFAQESVANATHEFGHTLGLGHSQPYLKDSGADPNCKPNYPSVMNYAYYGEAGRGFADGWSRPALNNVALREQGAVPSPTSSRGQHYLADLEDVFGYAVDHTTGDVDWNRDGVFSAGTVRAYANDDGGDCEFTRYNKRQFPAYRSNVEPALVRSGIATLLFYLNESGSLASLRTYSDFECDLAVSGCNDVWSHRGLSFPWNGGIQAFDVHPIRVGGSPHLLVVYTDVWHQIWAVRLHWSGSWEATTPRRIDGIAYGSGISLTGDASHAWLAYRGSAGYLRMNYHDVATGVWGDEIPMLDLDGDAVQVPVNTAPAILEPYGEGVLYGAFATGGDRKLQIWTMDPRVMRWEQSIPGSTDNAWRRPALAWVDYPASYGMRGRLHVLYARPDGPVRDAYTMVASPGGPVQLGMDGDFDNGWFSGYGVDLWHDGEVGDNLRAVVAWRNEDDDQDGRLELRPKADGILDHPLVNWNNWETMRVGICRSLVRPRFRDPQGVGSASPIACPPWP